MPPNDTFHCHKCNQEFPRKMLGIKEHGKECYTLCCQRCWGHEIVFHITCDPDAQEYRNGGWAGVVDAKYVGQDLFFELNDYKMDHLRDGLMEEEEQLLIAISRRTYP